ncbi:hypothetical protein BC828DRAFT_394740 [Blastocladiella britannica]|nr:hypothetical protein BC828DRAFT_394740 [Blastocladiella britannica]
MNSQMAPEIANGRPAASSPNATTASCPPPIRTGTKYPTMERDTAHGLVGAMALGPAQYRHLDSAAGPDRQAGAGHQLVGVGRGRVGRIGAKRKPKRHGLGGRQWPPRECPSTPSTRAGPTGHWPSQSASTCPWNPRALVPTEAILGRPYRS